MTNRKNKIRRVMVAFTEGSSLPDLWRAALDHLAPDYTELVTVFVTDDRWRRAASLPFTREVSRLGGASRDFTLTRAEEVDKDAAAQTQDRIKALANEASVQFVFEILAEHEAPRIRTFVTSESDVLILPSLFKRRPIYAEIARLKCRVLVVDSRENNPEPPDD